MKTHTFPLFIRLVCLVLLAYYSADTLWRVSHGLVVAGPVVVLVAAQAGLTACLWCHKS